MSNNSWWGGPERFEPPIEEPENRHKKKRGGKKPFTIESRHIGPKRAWEGSLFKRLRQWHVWSRYKTEKQRDDALRTLQRKESDPNNVHNRIEYRKGE